MKALSDVEGQKFSIPPRSPDLNPIENIFHIAKCKLKNDALCQKITKETWQQFVKRVETTLHSIPISVIDKTIDSMAKRLNEIIAKKGEKTKY